MRHTGIIRRLDRLGRVVIPMEYRKLHKIKITDPLEIIALDNGDIIVRKTDLTAQLRDAGLPIIEEVFKAFGNSVMLTTCDRYIASTGKTADGLVGTVISSKAQNLIEQKKSFKGLASEIGLDGGEFVLLYPVAADDIFGSLIMFSDNEIQDCDVKVLDLSSKILGNTMQRF